MWIGCLVGQDTSTLPITIVETNSFLRASKEIFSEDEIAELKFYIACNPEEGDVIPDTGGLRKIRWAVANKGKSSGARIIYFYYNSAMPVFLLAVYKKSEKINISHEEKLQMKKLIEALKEEYLRPNQCA